MQPGRTWSSRFTSDRPLWTAPQRDATSHLDIKLRHLDNVTTDMPLTPPSDRHQQIVSYSRTRSSPPSLSFPLSISSTSLRLPHTEPEGDPEREHWIIIGWYKFLFSHLCKDVQVLESCLYVLDFLCFGETPFLLSIRSTVVHTTHANDLQSRGSVGI